MSVRPDTWMPLYVADYLKDTTHLSTIEHGAYLLLLMHAWTHEGLLPADETRIGRIAGLSPREWKASRSVLLEYFKPTLEGFRHGRVDKEMGKAGNMIEQRRAAGKASAAARAAKRDDQQNGNGAATSVPTTVERDSRPSPSQEGKKERTPQPPVNLPADVRSVMEEGGFVTPPPDLGMLREWYGAGATLDQDILPMVRKVAASLSKPPFKLKVFDAAIREKLAADEREIDRLKRVTERYSDQPPAGTT